MPKHKTQIAIMLPFTAQEKDIKAHGGTVKVICGEHFAIWNQLPPGVHLQDFPAGFPISYNSMIYIYNGNQMKYVGQYHEVCPTALNMLVRLA